MMTTMPMATRSKRAGVIALLIAVLSVSLVACGGEAAPAAPPTSTPQATQATEGAASTATETATFATPMSEAAPTDAPSGSGTTATTGTAGTAGTASTVSCARLNLNQVTQDQLMSTIPGFSSRMVREFMEYRPYSSIQQFRQEIGKYVDASQVAEYEKYVYVPVDPNNSDAETLKQLPGVDDTIAASLIKSRPYASDEAFLQALSAQVSVQQLAGVGCYLGAD